MCLIFKTLRRFIVYDPMQTSAQDSRCSDEDTDTRSVSQASESDQPDDYRLSSGYHCIPLEILPLQAEAPLDSDTWESGREEEG